MERELFGYLAATAAVAIGYIDRRVGPVGPAGGQWSWNVLAITQGVHARASLSKLQLFFFTLVVLWVVVDLFVKNRPTYRLIQRRARASRHRRCRNSGRKGHRASQSGD